MTSLLNLERKWGLKLEPGPVFMPEVLDDKHDKGLCFSAN